MLGCEGSGIMGRTSNSGQSVPATITHLPAVHREMVNIQILQHCIEMSQHEFDALSKNCVKKVLKESHCHEFIEPQCHLQTAGGNGFVYFIILM